jgi:hypothetical protein
VHNLTVAAVQAVQKLTSVLTQSGSLAVLDTKGLLAMFSSQGMSPMLAAVIAPGAVRQWALARSRLARASSSAREHGPGDPDNGPPGGPLPPPVTAPSAGAAAASGAGGASAGGATSLLMANAACSLGALHDYRFSLAVRRPVGFISLRERPG